MKKIIQILALIFSLTIAAFAADLKIGDTCLNCNIVGGNIQGVSISGGTVPASNITGIVQKSQGGTGLSDGTISFSTITATSSVLATGTAATNDSTDGTRLTYTTGTGWLGTGAADSLCFGNGGIGASGVPATQLGCFSSSGAFSATNSISAPSATTNLTGAVNSAATVGGTANAITLTNSTPITSYASSIGMRGTFVANGTNTISPPTIAMDGKAALNTTMGGAVVPVGGIISGAKYNWYIESATSIAVSPWDAVSSNGDTMNGPLSINMNTAASAIPNIANTQFALVAADGNPTQVGIYTFANGASPMLHMGRALGTAASPLAIDGPRTLGGYEVWGYDGTSWASGSRILGIANSAWTTSSHETYIQFWVTPSGSVTSAVAGSINSDKSQTWYGNSLVGGSILSNSPTGGIGYTTGTGGTVTQSVSRTTGVTLSKVTGTIITDTTSLAAGAFADFTVTNTAVALSDVVIPNIRSGSNSGNTSVRVLSKAAGSFVIRVFNQAAATAETGAIIIDFVIMKGSAS